MRLIWLTVWSWLTAGSSTFAAEEKPFMSFYNPTVWEIPGIKHDLPRLAAWLGVDGLQFLSERGEKIDDPKRFDGTAWYAGGILLIGELVDSVRLTIDGARDKTLYYEVQFK